MSEEAINKRNEMFREVHPAGPATHEKTFVTVDESVYREAMTLKDVQEKNRQTVDDLFKQEEIGSVFEKGQKLEEKALSHEKNEVKPTSNNNNNGIDPNAVDALKKLSDQEKGMKEPSVESSLGFIK